ncbi:hypothetical protein FZO89_03385 [Luteimonas viscosa]|uniref:Uncharacterized protein n=1 Tax=Luteimonas viscosa TaxID=1132694 RepID=A0A5D4XN50_9GAMM|nr:hypothetical protein [Luteimonas viscosa]TYT25385.1 hypothetical protein FZO89_03385 [Luteimonas viscosa]
MPITRAKASRLLNQKEMALYDDSRINGLRKLDEKALASRIKRARTARDRARNLVQKHKLAARARSGSKRGASGEAGQRSKDKADLMADILKRFEGRLRDVGRERAATASRRKAATAPAKKNAPARRKTATRKTTTAGTKTAAKKSTSRRAATGATSRKRAASGKGTAARASGSSSSPGSATKTKTKSTGRKPARKSRAGHITPEQALAQTRALLEAKQARDHEPKPWEAPVGGEPVAGSPGYQSDSAARRARRLHAAEARIPAIQGSSSTRDRVNQGKRDRRQGSD